MIEFLVNNYEEIFYKSLEHLYIASLALILGIIVAVPLGILLTRNKRIADKLMAIVSILQTIPSFALLAMMIPIFGVGKTPAVAALFIYSLLPIMRNTYLGIDSVEENITDAAKGMGMTAGQILFKVQIPLAMPVIMSGIRLSAVYVLAWTSLSGYIGAGGLGEFIFTGLENAKLSMVLWGTVPVTIMALVVDKLFSMVENYFSAANLGEA